MKAFVDPDLCIGCTQCAGICPEVFSMEGTLAVAQPGELPANWSPPPSTRRRIAPSRRSPSRNKENSLKIFKYPSDPCDFVLYYKV